MTMFKITMLKITTARPNKLLWILMLVCASASAGKVNDVDVTLNNNTYTMKVDAWVQAPKEEVFRVITDYPNLSKVNNSIIESKVIERYNADQLKLWNIAEVCVLFYCKHIRLLQNVIHSRKQGISILKATVFPKQSSFKYGVTSVELREHNAGTQVNVLAQVVPSFWVPPYIGAWILEWKLGYEAEETMLNIERLIHSPPDQYTHAD